MGGDKLFQGCPETKCVLTFKRSATEKAAAIMFSWVELNMTSILPEQKANQPWVFFTLESPSTDMHYRGNRYSRYENRFNLTMSYRKDSDVYMPYDVLNITEDSSGQHSLENITKAIKKKTKTAAWFVSNHHVVPSKRNRIVNELKKNGIDIDIYGLGNKNCSRSQNAKCMKLLNNNYKFYLSFENSNCKDYITEKLYKVLDLNVVPIVLGGGNYRSILPEKSYIDVSEYPSGKHLADHLKVLDENDHLYLEYFKWRINKTVIKTKDILAKGMCDLCKTLHSYGEISPGIDLKKWWFDHKCIDNKHRFDRKYIDFFYKY